MINVPGLFIEKYFVEKGGKFKKRIFVLIVFYILISLAAAATYFVFDGLGSGKAIYYGFTTAAAHEFLVLKSPVSQVIAGVVLIGQWVFLWLTFESVVDSVSEGKIKELMEGRQLKKVAKLKEHIIVVGGGRVGSKICHDLKMAKKKFVIVERDMETARGLAERGYTVICGDTVNEETLLDAGVQNASKLVTALGSDADNVFVTLTAKELNPQIYIVARAEKESSVRKLKQAGASEIVMPSIIGGKAMANAVLK